MINVCCVSYNNKKDIDKIKNLYDMLQKYLTLPYKFYCFTDQLDLSYKINDKIIFKTLPRKDLLGWWNKLQLFNSEIQLEGVNIFLDLNIKITKNINNFVTYDSEYSFNIMEDFKSNIIKWNNKTASFIWEEYINKHFSILHVKFNDEIASIVFEEYKNKNKKDTYYSNEQQVIRDIIYNNSLLKFFPKEWSL
jgi:hypothetical protein